MKVPGNDPPVKHTRIEDQLSNVTSTKSKMSRQLMSTIPWRNRVKYDATPWRVSDKQRLEGKLQDMVYWNDKLYDMLPHELRDSILRQGLSSFMLSDPKEAKSLSRLGYAALSEQAGFMEVYRQLMADNSITSPTPDEMRQRLIDIERFELVGGNYGESFSIMRSPTGQGKVKLAFIRRRIQSNDELKHILSSGTKFKRQRMPGSRCGFLSAKGWQSFPYY